MVGARSRVTAMIGESRRQCGASAGVGGMSRSWWQQQAQSAVPPLSGDSHKGQAGRVAVVGGSLEYTGAPFFAAISALKVGADLSHVFCTKEASTVVKSYSPELIVHPLLSDGKNMNEIKTWLSRIHVLVIGPGLGRNPKVLDVVKEMIRHCKEQKKPLVIDADGLHLVTENLNLIRDYPSPGVILTPNKAEFERLYGVIKANDGDDEYVKIDYDKLGKNVLVLKKGATDQTFCVDNATFWSNGEGGSGRRCGGQGDILSGTAATFFNWCLKNDPEDRSMMPAAIAAHAAARLTRLCNEKAFEVRGRSMTCTDMIDKISPAFKELYETS